MKRKSLVLLAGLLLLTAILAFCHLHSRSSVPAGHLSIEYQGQTIDLALNEVVYTPVNGFVHNGKGEQIEINAEGILLADVLQPMQITSYTQITVIADDEYRAVVTREEISCGTTVWLIQEDSGLRLVVFGDSNSKRRVNNVKRLVIE